MLEIMKDFYREYLKDKEYFYISNLNSLFEFKGEMLNTPIKFYHPFMESKDLIDLARKTEKTIIEKTALNNIPLNQRYLAYFIFLENFLSERKFNFENYPKSMDIKTVFDEIYLKIKGNESIFFTEKELEDYNLYINNFLFYYNEFLIEDISKISRFFLELGFLNVGNTEDTDFYYRGYKFYTDNTKYIEFFSIENGITEFLEAIRKINPLYDKGKEFFYRGQINNKWKLEPSIFRNDLIKVEKMIYDDCISKLPDNKKSNNVYENLLTIQHNDGPTRLLDITENPLVALFFACFDEFEKEKEKDGVVYVFYEKIENIKYFNSDTVQVVSNLSRMNNNFSITEANSRKQLIHCIRDYRNQFDDRIIDEHLNNSYIIKGVLSNERIISQSGSFILVGMGETKEQPSTINQLSNYRIIIKADRKQKILEELALLNISEDTIYPELNKRMKQLKNKWIMKAKDIN